MSFLLKIVEGPNKGAEIALVEGVAVTLGKGDDCDIVLADATMPDEPLSIEAASDGVTVGGEPLEALHVKTYGATSFAVGPADAPWSELVWPKREEEEPSRGESEAREEASADAGEKEKGGDGEKEIERGDAESSQEGKRKRGGCCGCLVAAFLLLLLLAGLAWLFRKKLNETGCLDGIKDSRMVEKVVAVSKDGYAWTSELVATWRARDPEPSDAKPSPTLPGVVEKYGLSLSETDGVARVSGNLKTRRERLAATAEAYAVRPGVELDLSDDESLRTSAEDALFSLTEGALKVSAATNRAVVVVGHARSAAALKRTLEALNADVPKLRAVDVSGVAFTHLAAEPQGESGTGSIDVPMNHMPSKSSKAASLSLPVCGILTTPYPCLISRDGRRYLEGAEIGGGIILKIGADSVVLTNSTGRFTWKP